MCVKLGLFILMYHEIGSSCQIYVSSASNVFKYSAFFLLSFYFAISFPLFPFVECSGFMDDVLSLEIPGYMCAHGHLFSTSALSHCFQRKKKNKTKTHYFVSEVQVMHYARIQISGMTSLM